MYMYVQYSYRSRYSHESETCVAVITVHACSVWAKLLNTLLEILL